MVARAPVRVADVGGWTDTWFGSPGRVCHLAVGPGVEVRASLADPSAAVVGESPVHLRAPDLGEDYRFLVLGVGGAEGSLPGRQPLMEHAIAEAVERARGCGTEIEVVVSSAVPAGASLGTSAAVAVAVLAALDELLGTPPRSPEALAAAAHEVETQRAGREAGVQDQWAAAFGGCGHVTINPYPTVRHRAILPDPHTEAELADRLVTVAFGPHDSSAVHAEVIDAVIGCGGAAHDQARRSLGRLAALADDAAVALEAGDIGAWASVLSEATETQRALHPALVGPAHQAAIDCARSAGVAGWKVNGAGGAGGSLTVVAQDPDASAVLAAELLAIEPTWDVLDLVPSRGLTVEWR